MKAHSIHDRDMVGLMCAKQLQPIGERRPNVGGDELRRSQHPNQAVERLQALPGHYAKDLTIAQYSDK